MLQINKEIKSTAVLKQSELGDGKRKSKSKDQQSVAQSQSQSQTAVIRLLTD